MHWHDVENYYRNDKIIFLVQKSSARNIDDDYALIGPTAINWEKKNPLSLVLQEKRQWMNEMREMNWKKKFIHWNHVKKRKHLLLQFGVAG